MVEPLRGEARSRALTPPHAQQLPSRLALAPRPGAAHGASREQASRADHPQTRLVPQARCAAGRRRSHSRRRGRNTSAPPPALPRSQAAGRVSRADESALVSPRVVMSGLSPLRASRIIEAEALPASAASLSPRARIVSRSRADTAGRSLCNKLSSDFARLDSSRAGEPFARVACVSSFPGLVDEAPPTDPEAAGVRRGPSHARAGRTSFRARA